jgi:amino acid adenylation domain-containing protein
MKHDVEDIYELSPLQQGMLFHSLEAPDAGVYLIRIVTTVEGALDAGVFEDAWRLVVARQPVLRTSFHWGTISKPVQVVHRQVPLAIVRQDWRELSEEGRAGRLDAYLAEDAAAPMPLDTAPLMRLALLRVGEARWQMVWSFPHILLEGWSASLVIASVFEAYHALRAGTAPAVAHPPRYRDYIAWLQRQDARAAETHWRATLEGFAAPTPLPMAAGAGSAEDPEYARQKIFLPPDVSAALQALGRQQRLTLSTIFQGAWALLLARYSGEPDVVFGSVVSGREVDFPGVESLVGLCVNTLPLRARIVPDESTGPWLRRIQDAHARSRQFEYCALVDVQRWSDMPRGTRLFESIFVFENWAAGVGGGAASADVRIVAAESVEGGTGYPLVVEVAPGRETSIAFAYDTRRLAPETIERMLGHYAALLEDIGRHPRALLRELSILSGAERQRILETWNDTAEPHDESARLHDMVIRQARATPDAVAVSAGGKSISYGELDARSAALAAHLRGLGVRPGVLVAVFTGRSVELVVALLGVLRAGGAYVPLDPAFPAQRLAHMLADAACPVAIVDRGTAADLPAASARLVLADEPGTWTARSTDAQEASPDDLAYVIYTSGSTGTPKGVQIPHGAVVNFLESMQRELTLTSKDRLVAVTTLSFDIAGLELFLPLTAGARVVIADRETALDGVRLAAALHEAGATIMQATPATWRQLIDSGWTGLAGLKILCGGESLPRELAGELLARGEGLWNLYGPTETTIWSTIEKVEAAAGPVSIGKPIANTKIYILDDSLQPVPPGVRGDLFIAGRGLARGYVNRPDLTAERFVPDPFGAGARDRMYRTGDHARYLPDGRIEWIGRADHQVKVRGFRIELGEIESALRQHPAVVEAVALVREDVPGDRRIAAYVITSAPEEGLVPLLRAHLQTTLPDYMIPSAFVPLTAWPRTPNGKIDRRALPAPEGAGPETGFVAPRTPVEELVAGIWCEVLGLSRVGAHDNFFELGGHSLLATRILSRIRTVLGRDVPLRRIFNAPTVAGFVESIESTDGSRLSVPPIELVDRTRRLPLSFAQERLWFVHQLDPESSAYNLAGAVRLQGALDVAALQNAFAEIVRRHEALRSAVVIDDGMPVLRIDPAARVVLHVLDWEGGPRAGESLEEHLASEARRPFDLTRAPLLRASLIRTADAEYVLVVTMHHLVSDAWSIGIFVRELGALYGAFARGEASPLPELPVQYADFASWQRGWLAGDRLESELAHWTKRLEGAPLVLELPADRPRPAVQTARGARHAQLLGVEAAEALRELGRREGATLYMTLLAAFEAVIQRYTGRNDFLVGSPIAGRTHADVEQVIGFFANTVVMRADLAGDPSVAGLLARVREGALDAYAHQDLPFERLVGALHPERDPGRNPVVQVMFALQNTPAEPLDLPGISWLPQEISHATSPFDLTLFVQETPQGLLTTIQYSTDLFDATTIGRLHGHLHRMLGLFASRPDARLSSLPLLTDAERDVMLRAWNETRVPLGDAASVQVLFEEAADTDPAALAVSCGGDRVSYAELDERANQVAHHLRAAGVGPERVVGVCLSRSPSLLVAILGILKAGGAYLPLDPETPAERLQFMLRDAGATVAITESRYAGALSGSPVPTICLDGADAADIDSRPHTRVRVPVSRSNLAYVIYTSGSTGRPKGVQIEHAGLLNLSRWHQRVHGVTAADRATQIAGLGFDATVWEIWPYLISGASIHLPDDESRLSPSGLVAWLAAERVTIAFLPTPLLEATLPERWPAHSLRRVLTGGDRLHRAGDATLGFELFNQYGPTENSVVTTWGSASDGDGPPPIGRPIDNTAVYLLDEQLRPVPIGVPGELHISGTGLSRGYVGRPDLTAERFVPDPFSVTPGGRLYRTGDYARYAPDGTLIFVGRMDGQVKLRGFRVELSEIEVALAQHPGVREAVVVVGQGPAGERLLAYITSSGAEAPTAAVLRAFLAATLPEYMIPIAFVPLDSLPLTPNGKVDRAALAAAERMDTGDTGLFVAPATDVERAIASVWTSVLQVEAVGIDDNFFDRGGHSLLLMQVHRQLQQQYGGTLRILDLFRYPTIRSLAAHIADTGSAKPNAGARTAAPMAKRSGASGAVAIVGMAGRFPGAPDVAAFWRNLAGGVESVTFFSTEELAQAGVDPAKLADPRYVPARAVVDGVEWFDAGFFGYSPREAELIDPQQRMFLECAWHALEDAACDPSRYSGRIGVFGGVGMNTYVMHILSNPAILEEAGVFQTAVASDKDFLASRVAYKLDLRGPAVTVQTGCSTSLVAVHVACRSLLDGECEMALAGGVRIALPQQAGYVYEPGGIVSPDGHCRAFDAGAQGTVTGSGAGVVALKRLEDALADGDPIVAVIRGSAINNDGSAKVGYTAPSVQGQAAVIRQALDAAGVAPAEISYVEVHGTGTSLGDPIEIAALDEAFADGKVAPGSCAIGSVKTNIGHLDAAAGVAGLIKTAMSLKHATLPASLHFETPHPEIDFASTPFFVNSQAAEWPAARQPRRAGVSSFGIGGTNAHVVVEEAPPAPVSGPSRAWQVLPVSARSDRALDVLTARLASYLEENAGVDIADAAFTLQTGRRAFDHRRAVICRGTAEATEALGSARHGETWTAVCTPDAPRVAFMFPGQGAQYAGMGRGLYDTEPVFRDEVDGCAALLEPHLGFDIRTIVCAADSSAAGAQDSLDQTALAQPALFVVEYATARMWESWGVQPVAMIGHSIGEYVAACLAGVFSLEDALRLVAARGRLMQGVPPGGMLAVSASADGIRPLLPDDVAVAALNGPEMTVVSGPLASIGAVARRLRDAGIDSQQLHTSHAFHSPMMDAILPAFEQEVRRVRRQPPRLPFVSNVTGAWITADEATDPEYWAAHLRQPVRFEDGVRVLLEEPARVLLEAGPGTTLTTLVRRGADATPRALVATGRHPRDSQSEEAAVAAAVARLWVAGVDIDWKRRSGDENRRRVSLPGYPFEHKRYWIDAPKPGAAAAAIVTGKRPRVDDWFYTPSWRPQPLAASGRVDSGPRHCLVIGAASGNLAADIARGLEQKGHTVSVATYANAFSRTGNRTFDVTPEDDGFDVLLDAADRADGPVSLVVQACGEGDEVASSEHAPFHRMMALLRALGRRNSHPVEIAVVGAGIHGLPGSAAADPHRAMLLGACRVAAQEYGHVTYRSIDVERVDGEWRRAQTAARIAAELTAAGRHTDVALRDGERLVQTYDCVPFGPPSGQALPLRDGGVYMITGGLGEIGLALAAYLARAHKARLVLLGRTPLPPRSAWPDIEATGTGSRARLIERIRSIEALGEEVMTIAADVADTAALAAALDRVESRFGRIDGVIHAAGVTTRSTMRPIAALGPAECEEQFRPKVAGVVSLARALTGRTLDFCLVTSSLSTVLGGPGLSAYAAANLFLNAFVRRMNAEGPTPWTALLWDGWSFPAEDRRPGRFDMQPDEGVETFRRALSALPVNELVVSTGDLQARIDQWVRKTGAEEASAGERYERPDLASVYAAPVSETEIALAEIWRTLLGLERIGTADNFFELGGHSLLALRLMARLQDAFQIELPVQAVFDAPTIAQMAAAVDRARQTLDADVARMEEMLRLVEALPEDELRTLLEPQE